MFKLHRPKSPQRPLVAITRHPLQRPVPFRSVRWCQRRTRTRGITFTSVTSRDFSGIGIVIGMQRRRGPMLSPPRQSRHDYPVAGTQGYTNQRTDPVSASINQVNKDASKGPTSSSQLNRHASADSILHGVDVDSSESTRRCEGTRNLSSFW